MDTPTDEQVQSYIDSVPGLRQEWGIPQSKRLAAVTFVIMNICLLALVVGTLAYLLMGDPATAFQGISGVVIVIVLAYAACALRYFQLKAGRAELPKYRETLAKALTGNPETDPTAQKQVDESFKWDSLKYRNIARMIGLAGIILIAINTYQLTAQTGMTDFARQLIFDAAIIAFFVGALWNNYALKTDIAEIQLEERSRATIKWQTEHPGETQRMEEAESSDDAQMSVTLSNSGVQTTHHIDDDSSLDE